MQPAELSVRTDDGRALRVRVVGEGPLILVHHGTPASSLLLKTPSEDALGRGARYAAFDRAGYGGSDAKPGRSIADVASDCAAVADALGAERFVTWGISGGGPHALACAALLPDRVAAAATLAGVGPWGAEGLDWLDGMGEENVDEFGLALQGADVLEPALRAWREEILGAGPEALAGRLETLLSDVDRAAFSGRKGEELYRLMAEGIEPGIEGWRDDDLAFTKPWGFDLARIETPVLIWQGEQDRFLPPAHGRWLAAHVPGCEARLTADDGHLTLTERRIGDVHGWLLDRL